MKVKKIISLILSFAIAFSIAGAGAIDVSAAMYVQFEPGQYCEFNLQTGEFERYRGNAATVVIPSEIEGVPVKSVTGFGNNTSVEKIVVPEGVERIENSAFWGCSNLHTIELPDSLTYIGNDIVYDTAFYFNESNWTDSGLYIGDYLLYLSCCRVDEFTEVCEIREGTRIIAGSVLAPRFYVDKLYIPDSVEYIGERSIAQEIYDWGDKFGNGPSNMKTYAGIGYIGKYLVGIPTNIFEDGKNIVIKPGAEVIPAKAFAGEYYYKSVYTPKSLKKIPVECFAYSHVEKAILPYVEIIEESAFNDCEKLKKVQLSEKISEIGENAFSECISLETIELFGNLKTIKKRTFAWDTSLNNIIIHKGVEKIEDGAFTGCSALTDIYYTGSEEDWEKIGKTINGYENTYTDDYNCGISPDVRIHYNYKAPKVVYDDSIEIPETINEVTITGKGTAYGRFRVYDSFGNPAENMKVNYTLNGSLPITITSDELGYVLVSISGIKKDTDYNIRFSGKEITPSEGVLKVKVKPLEFSANYEATFTQGANVGAGLGAGTSIAAIEADASLVDVGVSGSLTRGLSLSQKYSGGKNKVSVTSRKNLEGAIEAKTGLFAGVNTDLGVNLTASAGDISAESGVGTFAGVTFEDEDFDINDKNDVEQMAKFVLGAALDSMGSNVVAKEIVKRLGVEINAYESGNTASVGAGANLGVFGFKGDYSDAAVTIGGINAKSVWSHSAKVHSDGEIDYSSSLKSAADAALFNFKLKTKGDNNVSGGSTVWAPENISNDIKVSATRNPENILTSLSITGKESESKNILLSQSSENKMYTITYPQESAAKVAKNNGAYGISVGGKAFLSLEEWEWLTQDMLNSGEKAEYNTSVEVEKGINASLSGSIKLLAEIGGKIGVSGVQSYEYDLENGIYEDGTVYVQAKNDIAEEVAEKVITIETLVKIAEEKMVEILGQVFEVVSEKVEGVIDSGKEKLEYIGEGVSAAIKKTKEDMAPARVFALRTTSDDGTDALAVTTVGNPRIISAMDDSGDELAEFSQKPLLTLYYTEEELESAGVENQEDIRLMRFDENLDVYTIIDAEHNQSDKSFSAEISKTGQYILGVDNIAPVITNFSCARENDNYVIKALIADISKNSEAELIINEEKVLDTEKFYDYYDSTTGRFEYPIKDYKCGEYYGIILNVKDQFGNSAYEEQWIWIPENTLEIKSFEVADVVNPTSEARVVFGEDTWVENVYLNAEYVKQNGEKVVNHIRMEEAYDEENDVVYYKSFMPEARADADVTLWVDGYDSSGTRVQSEKKSVRTAPVSISFEEALNGYTRVSCSNNADLGQAKIIVAVYDAEGKMLNLKVSHAEKDVVFTGLPYDAVIKAYLWDGINPLCNESVHMVKKDK